MTISSNAIPCHAMNGMDVYAQCPTPVYSQTIVPKPNLCPENNYYASKKLGCQIFDSREVAPVMTHHGVLGRSAIKNSHWSENNTPLEAIEMALLPAECYDESPHKCNPNYTGKQRYSVYDVNKLKQKGWKIYYKNGQRVSLSIDEFHAHVQKDEQGGLYHYHAWPKWDNGDYADHVIGYALDGVPVMGRFSKLTNGKIAKSNYKLIVNNDLAGRYHFDYAYDQNNGGTLDG